MYFKYFNDMKYVFNGSSYTMKDIFSRPVIGTNGFDYARIDNNQTPDQSAQTLYEDNTLFYINLLLNNTLNKNDWPTNELDFTEKLNDTYKGYSFHILEKPSVELSRGDIVILTTDLANSEGDSTCLNNPSCYPSYGIIESWDPTLRKIWVREYAFGTAANQTNKERALFAENNTFKIFRRDGNVIVDKDGITITNASAFDDDPNYTPTQEDDDTYRTFKMRAVHEYTVSLSNFMIRGNGGNLITLNGYMKNLSSVYDPSSYVGDYSSQNTNETCSLIDAYILEAGGKTGTNKEQYKVDNRISSKILKDELIESNEEKRYVNFLNRNLVGDVVTSMSRDNT